LGNDWIVVDEHHLEKEFKFKDFQAALDFTNNIGALAEEVDHHPEICLTWGKARVTIWTHSIGGLSEADFVFAARADGFE
jgi:4a-hydroxytetrahydrobiopterin dehydratase